MSYVLFPISYLTGAAYYQIINFSIFPENVLYSYMQNTQLQEVLQKFMKKDLKTFSDYLRSPYFTKKITLLSFWEEIKEFAPDFEISELQKQQICEKISGKIFSDSYYRNLCSDTVSYTHLTLPTSDLV